MNFFAAALDRRPSHGRQPVDVAGLAAGREASGHRLRLGPSVGPRSGESHPSDGSQGWALFFIWQCAAADLRLHLKKALYEFGVHLPLYTRDI